MKKILGVILIAVTCMSALIYSSAAVAENSSEAQDSISEIQKEENHKKVDARLSAVWQDIKKTQNINEDDYIELDINKLNLFISGKLEGFTDQDLVAEMNKILSENFFNVPIGSTKPKILLNKNAEEIVLAYKESNGTNILCSFIKSEGNSVMSDSNIPVDSFEKVVKKSEGEPIPELK